MSRGQARKVRVAQAVLWGMRLGILAMVSVALAVLYHRYHQTDDQKDVLRYVQVDMAALSQVQQPIEDRILSLLSDQKRKKEEVREALVEDLIPSLVRLKKLAEAPLRSPRSEAAEALAREYLQTVDGLIEGCRTAVRVIDDPRVDGRTGAERINQAFVAAAEQQRRWRAHVERVSGEMGLGGR